MEFSKKNVKNLILVVCAGIFFHWALNHPDMIKAVFRYVRGLMAPFLIGAVIAFIINVPMRPLEQLFEKHSKKHKKSKMRRVEALLLTLLGLILVMVIVSSIVAPELYRTFQQLFKQIPVAYNRMLVWLEEVSTQIPGHVLEEGVNALINLDWVAMAQKAVKLGQNILSGLAFQGFGVLNSVIGSVTSFGIGLIFAIYILMQKEHLAMQGKQLLYAFLPKKGAERVIYVLRVTNVTFSRFVRGQCLEAVILACMFFVTMSILRMPYTLLVSVVICVTALIPILGSFIGCAVGVFLIAIGNPLQALIFLGVFLILQQVEGNLVYPYVVGNSVGLPGIWTLVAVTIGGSLMGIAGMLIFIPLSSVLYRLLKEHTHEKLKQKQITTADFM